MSAPGAAADAASPASLLSAAARAPRMSSGAAREVAEDDGGEATGGRPAGRLLRGRGAQGPQEPLRTSQGAGRASERPASRGAGEEHSARRGAQQYQRGGEYRVRTIN